MVQSFLFSQTYLSTIELQRNFFFRVKKEFEDSGGAAVGGPTPLATIPDEEGCVVADGGGGGGGGGGRAGLFGPEAAAAEASFGGPYREASKIRGKLMLHSLFGAILNFYLTQPSSLTPSSCSAATPRPASPRRRRRPLRPRPSRRTSSECPSPEMTTLG